MKTALASILLAAACFAARGSTVYSQLPVVPQGMLLPSQNWFDPTGQNNLDSDANAYDDFMLTRAATITHVEWWGQSGPSVGFFISFYNQDTNTVALQPDLPQFHGHAALASEEVTNVALIAVENGLNHFGADLARPVSLSAGRRYFLMIVDSMPVAFATWGWAQGGVGNGQTFYYQVAGSPANGPWYTLVPSDRAFRLADAVPEIALAITSAAGNATVISWPTNSAGFTLQQTAALGAGNWSAVTNAVNVVGANNQVVISSGSGSGFFRLSRP